MFPIWMNDGETEMPTDDIFYIVAKDGIYLKKSMGHFDTVSKVDEISMLGECESFALLHVSKITTRQFAQILTLFREVYKKYKAECNVILHYNIKRKRYRIEVPRQDVSGASVDYANGEESYKNYIRIGTIHSHANMTAFHSGTDQSDEEGWDGLHITLGKMDEDYFEISCSVMSSGERFMVNPEDYIEGVELIEYEVQRSYKVYSWEKGKQIEKPLERKLGYITNAPEKDLCHPKKWMDNVDKHIPKAVSRYGGYNYGQYGMYGHNYVPGMYSSRRSIENFYDYTNPKGDGLTVGQNALFSDLEIGDDEWNACIQCPYKEHKVGALIESYLKQATEDELAEMGLFYLELADETDNSFDVNENGIDINKGTQAKK